MKIYLVLLCASVLLPAGVVMAQVRPGIIVNAGYRPSQEPLLVAPSQVLTLTVAGLHARPLQGQGPAGQFVPELDGLRIVIRDAIVGELRAGIAGIAEAQCTQLPSGCEPTSTITIQIPAALQSLLEREAELGVSETNPVLAVEKDGTLVTSIPLRVVLDNLHVLSNCDETAIFVSLFSRHHAGPCMYAVTDVNGRLITAENPASPGSTLMLWAWGGGVSRPDGYANEGGESAQTLLFTPVVYFDYRINSAVRRPFGVDFVRSLSAVSFPNSGLTRISFVLPSHPAYAGLQACNGESIRSNLTFSIAGPNSHSGAAICVQP